MATLSSMTVCGLCVCPSSYMDVEGMSVGVGISMTRFLYSAGVVCSSLLLLLGDDTDAVDNLLSDGVTDDLRSIDVLE
eukprot:7920367-Ditylum_brightwellii.AAC.1